MRQFSVYAKMRQMLLQWCTQLLTEANFLHIKRENDSGITIREKLPFPRKKVVDLILNKRNKDIIAETFYKHP